MVTRNAPYLRWDDRRRMKVIREEAAGRGNYFKWTPERRAVLALMADKGYTPVYIAQVLGCSSEAVRRRISEDRLPVTISKPRPRRAKKTKPSVEHMMTLASKIRRFA